MVVLVAMDMNPTMNFSQIHYTLRITYSHLHNIKKMMLEKGWISIRDSATDGPNRAHIPVFTPKGKEVLNAIYNLLVTLDIDKMDIYKYKMLGKRVIKDDKGQGSISAEVYQTTEEVIAGDAEANISEGEDK